MINTHTTRVRSRRYDIEGSENQIIVVDTYGNPVSEDMGYEVRDLIHVYPGSSGNIPEPVESVIKDEPGSFRYRGDPISQVLKKLDDLKTSRKDLIKQARSKARDESMRTVKLRRRITRYRTRRERMIVFDDQGRARYKWVSRREAYHAWYYFKVTRVEPIRYRRLTRDYISAINDRIRKERQSLLARASELKADRAKQLRKELRTASASRPIGVIPITQGYSTQAASPLDLCLPPDYPTAEDSFVPKPTLARPGTPIVSFDVGPGFTLMSAWASDPYTGSGYHGYHQSQFILPLANAGRYAAALPDLECRPETIVPEPHFASRYDVQEGRAEINRLSMAVQSGHLSESDRSFILARSIGELKDLPATFKQGLSFLNSLRNLAALARTSKGRLASTIVGALTSKSTLKEAASWWLAWRFAVKPTIDDVRYLLDNGLSAAAEIRRTLSSLSNDFQDELVNLTTRAVVCKTPRVGSILASHRSDTLQVEASLPITIHGSIYHAVWGPNRRDPQPQLTEFDRFCQEAAVQGGCNYLYYDHESQYRQDEDTSTLWTRVLSDRRFITIGDTELTFSEFKRSGGMAGLLPRIAHEADMRLQDALSRSATVLHVPLEYREKVTAAVTGQFWFSDLQDLFFGQGPLQMLLDRAEVILTAWELAPLSFVIDWLATTHRSILTLSDLVSKQVNGLEPRDLVVSMTNLLYAHSPVITRELSVVSQVTRRVPFDTGTLMTLMSTAPRNAWARALESVAPEVPSSSVTTDISMRCSFDAFAGPLVKTGIRRFIRGRYQRSVLERIMDSMPRLRIRLDASKVATLLAMFGFR